MSLRRVAAWLMGFSLAVATIGCGGSDGNTTSDPNLRSYLFEEVHIPLFETEIDILVVYRLQPRQVANQSIRLTSSDGRFDNTAGTIQAANNTVVNFTITDDLELDWTGVLTMSSDGTTASLSLTNEFIEVSSDDGWLVSPFVGEYTGVWSATAGEETMSGTIVATVDADGLLTFQLFDDELPFPIAEAESVLWDDGVVELEIEDLVDGILGVQGNFTLDPATGGASGSGTFAGDDGITGTWSVARPSED